MCCGRGDACDRSGLVLTGEQVREVQRAMLEAFAPQAVTGIRNAARARYEAGDLATMARESRQAAAYWRQVLDCGEGVLGRGGSAEELLACDLEGRVT